MARIGLYEFLPAGEQQARSIRQTHICTRQGANYYTYGVWRELVESVEQQYRQRGEWSEGGSWVEADRVFVNVTSATEDGSVSIDAKDYYICILGHDDGTDATKPGEGVLSRQYWLLDQGGPRVTGTGAAGAVPSAPEEVTIDPPDYTGFAFYMDTVMEGVNSEETQPDRAGEYKFGERVTETQWSPIGRTGPPHAGILWDAVRTVNVDRGTIGVADNDADLNPLDFFFETVQPRGSAGAVRGDLFYIEFGPQWWIEYEVVRRQASSDAGTGGESLRWVLQVNPLRNDVRGAAAVIPAGRNRVKFQFARRAPTIRTPNRP